MNFYVGQEVVCIKTHSKGLVKKGVHYIIEGTKQGCCLGVEVNVGVKFHNPHSQLKNCGHCGKQKVNDGFNWFSSELFAPLESIPASHEIAVKKLIEESQTILN